MTTPRQHLATGLRILTDALDHATRRQPMRPRQHDLIRAERHRLTAERRNRGAGRAKSATSPLEHDGGAEQPSESTAYGPRDPSSRPPDPSDDR